MVFPDSISFGYCSRSAEITLALNKMVVDISAPDVDLASVAVLGTAWITITCLPAIAHKERVIRSMS